MPKRWTEYEIPDETARAVDQVFDRLYAMRPAPGVDGEDGPRTVELSDGARAEFAAFVNEWNEQLQALDGAARAAAAKLEGYAARFALVRHCLRQAAGEKESDFADGEDVRAGIELARWFRAESLRVYRHMGESQEQRQRRELLDVIYRLGGTVTPRDLMRHLGRLTTADDAEMALNELADASYGAWDVRHAGGRGRPARVFVLADSPDFPATHRVDTDTIPNSHGKTTFLSTSTPADGAALAERGM